MSEEFETNFNCKETNQSPEYVTDVRNYVRDMSLHFDRRETYELDLSTLGLGFVRNGIVLPKKFHHILSLNLSSNVIKTIDMTFLSHYPNIQALDLSKNCLTSLNIQHRLAFSNIATLNFSQNLITTIHPFVFSNTSFEHIDLSHNRLIRFWAADYEINQLLLNHNRITQIDIDSVHRKEMKKLDARSNRLKIIQVNVDFENLILTNNQLEMDEYFKIRNVYGTLDLSRNHISEFEFDRKIISCVTNLNLSYNRLTTITAVCTRKRYQRVEQLNLDGNLLCSFDQSINVVVACLPNLKFISLLHNRMSGKMQIATKVNLTQLTIKSQVFDHEAQLFQQYDDDSRMNIFQN